MADQGRWFKLWISSKDDPSLSILPVADYGRWCKLGVYTKEHGTDGTVSLSRPSDPAIVHPIQSLFQVPNFDAAIDVIRSLPNIEISTVSPVTFATVTFFVTWRNWFRYQGDFSTDRVKKFREKNDKMKRSKKRGEEKRREEKKKREDTIAPSGLTGEGTSPDILVEAWNDLTTPPIPRVKELTEGRKRKIRARIRDRAIAEWRDVIRAIEATPFLRGDNRNGWTASFDWLIANAENAAKVIEGRYASNGTGGFDQAAELRKFVEGGV